MTDQPLQPGDDASDAPSAAGAKRLGEKYQDRVVVCWIGGAVALLLGGMIAGPAIGRGERFLGLVVMAVGLVALLLAIVATGARWGSHIADEDRRKD